MIKTENPAKISALFHSSFNFSTVLSILSKIEFNYPFTRSERFAVFIKSTPDFQHIKIKAE